MAHYSIAMLAACPFPANHGTPAAIREMSLELARRGHRVRVVTYPLSDANIPTGDLVIDRVRPIGRNRAIKVGPSYQRLVFDLVLIYKLTQVVRIHRIDLIHAHNYEGALIAGLVGRLTGRPVIYHAINTMIGELPSFGFIRPQLLAIGLARLLDYFTPRLADLVIADTEELRSFLLREGIATHRVITVHSGVCPEMFASGDGDGVRRRLGLESAPLIIYTGTLDQFQGVHHLLAAFAIVHAHAPEAKLLLATSTIDPAHREKYVRMAEELGIASAVRITPCELNELADFLAAADIAVVPRPESAGIPTKLLNYMAAGKAIVGFEKSSTILLDGVTGRLVSSVTAEDLAEGILSLLRDRALAAELGRNAQAAAKERFAWPKIAAEIETLYDQLLMGNDEVVRLEALVG